ncbi:MAG: Ig-like domain-containing protein, partial [Vicinamibacterales bacterium]
MSHSQGAFFAHDALSALRHRQVPRECLGFVAIASPREAVSGLTAATPREITVGVAGSSVRDIISFLGRAHGPDHSNQLSRRWEERAVKPAWALFATIRAPFQLHQLEDSYLGTADSRIVVKSSISQQVQSVRLGCAEARAALAAPSALSVSPSSLALGEGQSSTLRPVGHLPGGQEVAPSGIVWSSSDQARVSVNQLGVVSALAPGVADITATNAAGLSAMSRVTVAAAPAVRVSVRPVGAVMGFGSALQFTADAYGAQGELLAPLTVHWTTSDAAVATVTAGGLVRGVGVGVARITAMRIADALLGEVDIQVVASAPVISGVSPNPVPGFAGNQTLTVNGSGFASGAIVRLRDLTYGGTYDKTPTSSSSGQLQISANFTAVAATWSAQVINLDGGTSSQFSFTITAPVQQSDLVVQSISVSPTSGLAGSSTT